MLLIIEKAQLCDPAGILASADCLAVERSISVQSRCQMLQLLLTHTAACSLACMQVAAFGPSAARSLLFLGHIQSVSVAVWPAGSPAAGKLWQASVSTAHTSSGSAVRVGECLSA
jgi:hypothetical protein